MTTTPTSSSLRRSARATRPPAARRRVLIRWTKRGALALFAAGIVGALVYAWWPKPVVVDLATVRRGSLQVEIEEDGQTRVRDRFVVSAPISGDLQRIELKPGAEVRAGDTLLAIQQSTPQLLDARARKEATARLAIARARERAAATSIARATASRDVAIREAGRTRRLVESGAIAVAERDRAELAEQVAIRDLAAAHAERTAAAAEVEAAAAVLEPAREPGEAATVITVTSPANGRVLRTLRDSAGPVAAGAPLLEVGDPRALEVVVDVLSSDAAQITPGMPVAIERWGGSDTLAGRVVRVEPSAFTEISALGVEEQRVRVIVALDAPPPTLGDGFRVSARIITWRGDRVLVVPSSAVFRHRGQWTVYEVVDGRAVLRALTPGHRGRLDLEVADGLSAGARVIVHPSDRVRDGIRVVARDLRE